MLLSHCTIAELDLAGATVQRLELRDCRIKTRDGLRGATIDDAQLSLLVPVSAVQLGIIVT